MRDAKKQGLPIDKLLITNDDLEGKRVAFLDVRNKFDHGDVYQFDKGGLGNVLLSKRRRDRPLEGKEDHNPTDIQFSQYAHDIPHRQLKSAHDFLVALYDKGLIPRQTRPKAATE